MEPDGSLGRHGSPFTSYVSCTVQSYVSMTVLKHQVTRVYSSSHKKVEEVLHIKGGSSGKK